MAFLQNKYNPLEDASVSEASTPVANAKQEDSPFRSKEASNYESTLKTTKKNSSEAADTAGVSREHRQTIVELQKRQEELDERAPRLSEREKVLKSDSNYNFPPIPFCCPCEACFHQDIQADIPSQYQKVVSVLFYAWMAYITLLVWNMLICLAYFVTTVECNLSNHSAVNFTLALFNIIFFTPASYIFWFRPLYRAFKYESSINFFIFFIFFSLQFVANVFQALAIDGWGFVGILNCLDMFSTGQGSASLVGVFMMLTGVAFGILACFNLFLLVRVHQVYRSSGGSLQRAQQEFHTPELDSKKPRNSSLMG